MKASRLGPARLPGMGRVGAGTCTIFSQHRQDFLGRAVSMTFSFAVTISRMEEMSSSIRRKAPPQSAQMSPGSRLRRSRGIVSQTRGRRRGVFGGGLFSSLSLGSTVSPSSGGKALFSALAISSPSRTSSSCSISRWIFSELAPNFCFFSRAL